MRDEVNKQRTKRTKKAQRGRLEGRHPRLPTLREPHSERFIDRVATYFNSLLEETTSENRPARGLVRPPVAYCMLCRNSTST